MNEVESVALWVGIFAGIAGIVLAVVAIWFARSVDDRAKRVSDQTIRSLQKIETKVEGLSDDTINLIKVGWDRMLGQVGSENATQDPKGSAETLVGGMTAELEARIGEEGDLSKEELEKFIALLEDIEAPLASQIAALSHAGSSAGMMDHILRSLKSLSAEAQELVGHLHTTHLSRDEYTQLLASDIGASLIELREEGLLVPLKGFSPAGEDNPVYYFPPTIVNELRAALNFLPENPPEVSSNVFRELLKAGYIKNPLLSGDDGGGEKE